MKGKNVASNVKVLQNVLTVAFVKISSATFNSPFWSSLPQCFKLFQLLLFNCM